MRIPNLKFALPLILALMAGVVAGRELGTREARDKIAAALGITDAKTIHIKSIRGQVGGDVIVDATFDAGFHFTTDKNGNWVASEVRTGDRNWESIELITTAIKKEKALRTAADLRTLATALEAFKRDRGFYVEANTGAALIDNLAPNYIGTVMRLDAWSHEFLYKGTASSYTLSSAGPDGKPGTSDDIVMKDGKLVEGAYE
ncbi:MAG TPA: type II secretion system protein GspG [Blastocatellia bacterium]|nr:type II secretion system protein GspG [Blastocatellia bacterium]